MNTPPANIATAHKAHDSSALEAENKALLASASALVATEISAVNQLIRDELNSDIALINTLSEYIIQSGGKRLRPLIVLLAAKAVSPDSQWQDEHAVTLAAVIEFIHTATLLHDDVVDASALRRGNPTANDVWGNEASVLVGDFLYSRAFEMMVSVQNMSVMETMATTTNVIAEGEVMQLLNAHSPQTDEAAYLETIYRKTARLFESAAQLGAIITYAAPEINQALANYGKHLGNAFQLVDDMLDYQSNSDAMGKNTGDDLAEGKPTLPLIEAMRRGTAEQAKIIQLAIETGDMNKFTEVIEIVNKTGSLEYTHQVAEAQSQAAIKALSSLPKNAYTQALIDLAIFSTYRSF